MTDDAGPITPPPETPALAEQKAPRNSEDKPWEHPADGGAPLGAGDFGHHNESFGFFQDDEDFPDDVVQAIRRVYETMYRAGFRDWEAEWDYVEASHWFLRRHLEVNAREAFRLWFGDEKWTEPYRLACSYQEEGKVEYRIDHLLTAEVGTAIRKAEKTTVAPKPQYRSKKKIVLEHYAEVLQDGPLTYKDIARKINEKHGTGLLAMDVYNCLAKSSLVTRTTVHGKSPPTILLSLP